LQTANFKKIDQAFSPRNTCSIILTERVELSAFLGLNHHKARWKGRKHTKMYVMIVANTSMVASAADARWTKSKIEIGIQQFEPGHRYRKTYHCDVTSPKRRDESLSGSSPAATILSYSFTGPWLRVSDQNSSWPQMSMRYSSLPAHRGPSPDEVYGAIVNKGARLNLVFGSLQFGHWPSQATNPGIPPCNRFLPNMDN